MKSNLPIPDAIAAELARADAVRIILHRAPDGDTLGSCLALYLALCALGKNVALYCADPVPAQYSFLPGANRIENRFSPSALLVTVDCADVSMTGGAAEAIEGGAPCIVIDHHRSNRGYGTLNWIDYAAAAAAELVYDLLRRMSLPITPDIADCLYVGLVTDTGRFSFDYTRSASMRIAADLIERGAHFTELCHRIFRQRSLAKTRLIGAALSSLRVESEPRVAVMTITLDMLSRCSASHEDTEAIINYGIEIDGIEVAVLLHQLSESEYKVSFRSAGDVRVDTAAQSLGGGGHVKASGCTLSGSAEEILGTVLRAIREHAYR
ncbi:MAG: DHH family phosphoesterase [Christensenellales bacterium]|jgi:phosphoesterase RecJ-like protein